MQENGSNNNLRVALVHDFLVQQGGAERVLRVLTKMYPEAPVYTLLYDEEKMRGMFKSVNIRASYLQKFPKFLRKRYQWLLPFFPVIPETFDLRDFDLVISSSGAWSKGIVTKLNTIHVAYVHSPMRFIWDYNERYVKESKYGRINFIARAVFNYLRMWDRLAADRPDYLIANSQYTQKRIAKYYRRDAEVIYPPVSLCHSGLDPESRTEHEGKNLDSHFHGNDNVADYFLIVSRLSAYKRIDFVIESFNKLGLKLIIIGEGQHENYLKSIAKENVEFLGWQDDETIRQYYANATGFIFPTEDDFGITPVEAMQCGVPVLAYRSGGSQETVQEGTTGEFFDAQTPEVFADGIRRFMLNKSSYDKELIKKRGEEFSRQRFETEFGNFIENMTKNPKS